MSRANDFHAIPITRVVLFNSGVGFFERSGTVQDDAEVELFFKVDEVNDVLKSLVVEDLDGGYVTEVAYAPKDPPSKTLRSFAVDLADEPTLSQLLSQLRGQRVEVELEGEERVVGAILSVEHDRFFLSTSKLVLKRRTLNLLTDQGLRSLPLEQARKIQLLDKQVAGELRRALDVLAASHDASKKRITIRLRGRGERRVRIGYVQETPVWKTTYRLVLEKDGTALIQGWAIVENRTEDDWECVELSLVSGRPVSFLMNLYDPLYLPRPVEELQFHLPVRPQLHDQPLESYDQVKAGAPGELYSGPKTPAGRSAIEHHHVLPEPHAYDQQARAARLRQTMKSATQPAELGQFFEYKVTEPVKIDRQQSAMLPILNANLSCHRFCIYNESVHEKHPMMAVRLTNDTGLHLMCGPATVFDDGSYAGDAVIADVQPGNSFLVSYAVDLEVEVVARSRKHPEEVMELKIIDGTVRASHKFVRSRLYAVKNSGKKPKTILIEHAIDADWDLVVPPSPAERTRGHYRFELTVEPGQSASLEVKEQQVRRRAIQLDEASADDVRVYLSAQDINEEVRQALEQVSKRQRELQRLQKKLEQLRRQVKRYEDEQSRIRKNMQHLDRDSELFKQYVKKLTDQETRLTKLSQEITGLEKLIDDRREELHEYVRNLNIA